MGEIADWLIEREIEYWDGHLISYDPRSPKQIREAWYRARYKEERKMRKLTLRQVQRRVVV